MRRLRGSKQVLGRRRLGRSVLGFFAQSRRLNEEPLPASALVLVVVSGVVAVIVVGFALVAYGAGGVADWETAAVLAAVGIALAGICVEGVNGQYYCSAVAPIMAAVLFLPPSTAVASIVVINLVGVRNRHGVHRLIFNVSAFTLTCVPLAVFATQTHVRTTLQQDDGRALLLIIALSSAFAIASNSMFAVYRRLANGYAILGRGTFEVVVSDAGLAAFGCLGAYMWLANKWLAVLVLIPVGFIYRSQHAARLRKVADEDPKTGLFNARRFQELLTESLQADPEKTHGLLVVDVDHLRETNNRYGHLAGDAVIIGVGKVIQQHLRDRQYAARFGGEEFVVLAEGITERRLAEMAEAMRSSIASTPFGNHNTGQTFAATASFGAAVFPQDGDNPTSLFHAADMAVYRAKAAGRNQIVLASDLAPVTEIALRGAA